MFEVGQTVSKDSGDYRFYGTVVGKIWKLSGSLRYVVENGDGMLFIFNEGQLKPWANDI